MDMQMLLLLLLAQSYTRHTEGVQTNGTLANITEIGIGSNRASLLSINVDVMTRCMLICMNLTGCTGLNVETLPNDGFLCDMKEGAHIETNLMAMPGVRYIHLLTLGLPDEEPVVHDCADLYDVAGYTSSGVYEINTNPDGDPPNMVSVYCDMSTDGGKWLVLLRRQDDSVSFDRSWAEYQNMFGDITGNLWMGLEFMHQMTMNIGTTYEMRIDLTSFPRIDPATGEFTGSVEQGYAKYTTFTVGDATSFYELTVDGFTGDWGDSMARHNGMKFTAGGAENDHDNAGYNCAEYYNAPWWYDACSDSRLTGEYGMDTPDHSVRVGFRTITYKHGIMWYSHLGNEEHPQFVELKIRPL